VSILLPLLEKLCSEEETTVRDAAVDSLVKLVPKLPKPDVASKFVPLLKRLANGDWFTTRVSATGLFASAYPLVSDPLQTELRSLFNNLCNDDTPMVRKAAFHQLGKFSSSLQKSYFKTDVYPLIKTISQDDMDHMRMFAIHSCSALVKGPLETGEFASSILPIIESLTDDQSWRVRQELSLQYPDLCTNVTNDVGKKLLSNFAKLLKDREAEVRTAAANVLDQVCEKVRVGVLEYIVPCLDALAVDTVQNVRVNFSRCLVGLSPALGKDTAGKILVPLLQQLTKDEYYEVRNHIISRLDVLTDAIGAAGIVASVLPTLIDLAKDPKWRVRMGVIEKCALLAQVLGVKTFEKRLQPVIIGALSDHVFAIREIACQQIGLIVKEYTGKWAMEKLFPSAFAIYDKTTNYLHRMTCLLVIQQCAEPGGPEAIEKSLLPIVLQACTDDVPNVRIAAAKTLIELIPRMEKKVAQTKLQPLLQKMATDTDLDVLYFSQCAMQKIAKM
jgi:serine/threonine-protein phosphatase 2A regulatory subunit A